MAKICCSIELEPRTLNEGQINHAREAAVNIVQKLDTNEASNVFTEGLMPVTSVKDVEQIVEKGDQLQKVVECKEKVQAIEKPCQCSCSATIIESPDQSKLREPLSAPF